MTNAQLHMLTVAFQREVNGLHVLLSHMHNLRGQCSACWEILRYCKCFTTLLPNWGVALEDLDIKLFSSNGPFLPLA